MEALFLKDVKAISSAGRRRTNNKSSPNSRSRSSTSQINIATLRTSPTRNKGNQPASEILSNKVDNKSASSNNNCSGGSSKSGKRIQSSSTNDTSTLSEKTKRKRMSPKLKKLDSLATTSSPSSQRIIEGDISPMDYRPQQKRRRNKKKNHMPNIDNDTIDTSNGMLKEYVDQWTKSSSPTKSTRKREIKNNVVTTNNDKQDSSSASIISTSSSHSAVDNNDYECIVRSEGGVVVNKDIELEYGQLAFMKKDLERKMRLYQQGSTCITSTTPRNNNTVEENNKLELEYGKLSFMKQELEHKMSIYKMDAEKVGHQLSSTTRKEAPTRVFHAPSPSHNVMMDGESRMLVSASKNAINIERPDNHDLAAPSRQDVEFGARAFQRIMSERRRLPRVEDVGEHYQVPHKKRRRGYQYSGDEHDDDNDDDDDDYSVKHMDDSKSRSIHRCDEKKKRKRKRRVVETRVIRVFHEESEEAESGSTSTSPSYRTSKRLDYDRRQQGRQSLILPFNQGLKHTSISKEEKRNRIQNKKKNSSPSSVSTSRGRRHKQTRAKRQSSMLEGLL